ncbi:MAG: hypothetical protein J5372_09040 [Lachnospiraceae bacterium]|nr:hypothetical protein [Lachnospiraceae bacterium]
MTIWETMNTGLDELLITFAMLIMLYAGYLCMAFYRLGKKDKNTVISLILFVVYFAAFYMMLDGKFHYVEPDYYYYMDVDYIRTWPKVTTAFCSLPAAVVLVAEIITAIYLFWGTQHRKKLRKESLTRTSVKEAIDLLLAGVAFAKEDGNVVFANLSMNAISHSRTGKNMTDITGYDQNSIYSDGTKTWQFMQENITWRGKPYIQLTANDITEEARINDELKGKNKKLKEIRNRLEIYNRRAEQITISRELLNARRQVHSETGHILLASRHYMEHPDSIDEESFLGTLKLTNMHLLKEYEEDDTEVDQLAEAMEMAKAIAVRVKISGMIPEEGELRDILASAVNECATNTKKHADGDTLIVTTEEKDDTVIFTLTGNGEPPEKDAADSGAVPEKTIKETGGLASLRTLVENAGGTMEIKADEAFTIIIKMKKEAS